MNNEPVFKGKFSDIIFNPLHWLIILGAAGFIVFYPALHIPYYFDDLVYIFDKPFFSYNLVTNNYFFRPLEILFLKIMQDNFGLNSFPVHLVIISLHILLAWFIYYAMLRIGFSKTAAAIASMFMLFSQTNMIVAANVDTFSQVSATFAGCITLLLIFLYMQRKDSSTRFYKSVYYLVAVLAFLWACFSKENGIMFLPMLLLLLFRMEKRITQFLYEAIPFIVIAVCYLLIRGGSPAAMQPVLGSEDYEMNLDINIIKNIGRLLFSSFSPVSNVDVFTAIKSGENYFWLIMPAFVVIIIIAYGLLKSNVSRGKILLIVFSFFAMFPVILLNHVGETHTYNMMPFLSVLMGISIAYYLQAKSKLIIAAGVVFLMAVLTLNILAVGSKLSLMKDAGDRTEFLIKVLEPHIKSLPDGGTLYLVNPPEDRLEYSVFLINGFNYIKWGEDYLRKRYNRQDVYIKVMDSIPGGKTVNDKILTIQNGVIKKAY